MIPSSWIQLCRLHQEIEILLSLTLGFRRAWKVGKIWVLIGCWDDAPEWVLLHLCEVSFTASFFLCKAFAQVPMGMCCISFVPRKHEHVVKLVHVAWSPSSGALSRMYRLKPWLILGIHWSHKVETFCPCYKHDTWWSKILENENFKQKRYSDFPDFFSFAQYDFRRYASIGLIFWWNFPVPQVIINLQALIKGSLKLESGTTPRIPTWQWKIHHEWRCISYWNWDFPMSC